MRPPPYAFRHAHATHCFEADGWLDIFCLPEKPNPEIFKTLKKAVFWIFCFRLCGSIRAFSSGRAYHRGLNPTRKTEWIYKPMIYTHQSIIV